MTKQTDTGACPICGATENPIMHSVLGHKPRDDNPMWEQCPICFAKAGQDHRQDMHLTQRAQKMKS